MKVFAWTDFQGMIFCNSAAFAMMGLLGLIAIRENVVRKTSRFSRTKIVASFACCVAGLVATWRAASTHDPRARGDATLAMMAVLNTYLIVGWVQDLTKAWRGWRRRRSGSQ
jgi:hypothetical protein